jgi:hypothetical protein
MVYFGIRYHVNIEMANRLDEGQYSTDETITIKIPFNLPYQEEGKAFERVHGEFEYNGEFYKLIKQKVENGVLHVVCLKDKKQKCLSSFMADLVKMSTDLPVSSSTLKLMSSLSKDYVTTKTDTILLKIHLLADLKFHNSKFSLLFRSLKITTPPPEFLF